jgi:iron complex outermembrane recepter protein
VSPTSQNAQRAFLHCRCPHLRRALLAASLLIAAQHIRAQDPPRLPDNAGRDLTQLSMEGLMNIEVTSVSNKEQKLSRTAAAIFVITQEDIRRSGATNIPDLLRMVPGLDVAEINGSTWAIGSRGLNSQFANKLLVLVDGRSVYSPTFSGVFWDTLDLPLFDIDRIEVIRGPGGTIWGANAVIGVISIFTKKAAETNGTTLEAGGGTLQQGFGFVQFGEPLGRKSDFRVYTNYFNQSHLLDLNGQGGADGWHRWRSGFRLDNALGAKDSLTVEGDLSVGREGEFGFELPSVTSPGLVPIPEEINLGDGALETIWKHTYSGGSDSTLLRLLEKRGHRVAVAANGRQALQALDQQTFDLIFMDVQMPEMDGLEATAVIREKEKDTGSRQPIIALTAHAMKGDREKCLAAGMDGYLPKPIRPQDLDAALEPYLARGSRSANSLEPAGKAE